MLIFKKLYLIDISFLRLKYFLIYNFIIILIVLITMNHNKKSFDFSKPYYDDELLY